MLVLCEQDNDSKHEVSVGDRIEIRLSGRPATGYGWKMEGTLSCCSVVREHFEPPSAQTLGAGGQHVWELEAIASGEEKVIFEYRRSWEPDRPPASSFTATIRVLPQR